jgi:hypothetical protein
MYASLPNKTLDPALELSALFIECKCVTYHDACDYVWKLPYGRTSNSDDWKSVLSESTGTCSTKHALLKALADELRLNIMLMLGIYPMKESNTVGVGRVLSDAKIEYIPEAHCYLSYEDKHVDLTRFGLQAEEPISTFFVEKDIQPNDVGEVKRKFHKQYILEQYGPERADELWAVRERCIGSLSRKQTTP